MKSSSVFWGVVLSLLGMVLLLDNLGWLGGVQVWQILGPSLLILLGLRIVLGRSLGRKAQTEMVTVALDGAEKARIHINHAAGRLVVDGGAATGNLVEGTCTGGATIDNNRSGNILETRLSVPAKFFPLDWPDSIDWSLKLSDSTPLAIELSTGAGHNELNLETLQVNEVILKTGASSTRLHLSRHSGDGRVRVEAGVASVDISVPDGVAARVRGRGGLATIHVDSTAFPKRDEFHESPDFDTAPDRFTIDISTGVGTISVKKSH